MSELRALLDELDAARAAIGDSPAFDVLGFEQDDERVLACFDDGGRSVFAECYGTDAAALIVAAVNNLPRLVAALRGVLERLDFADGTGRVVYGTSNGGAVWARDIRAPIAAALTDETTIEATTTTEESPDE